MCSIILRLDEDGVWIGANRDEMLDRPWQPPAAYWPELPGVIAGRDDLAGGTWMGVNASGVMAAVLNRKGSLGPAPGKRSRGELPLLALRETNAATASAAITMLDAGRYRSFNLLLADAESIYFIRGLGHGALETRLLGPGIWMITSGEPNDISMPRIARYLPKFEASAFNDWKALLADTAPPASSALNVKPQKNNFGTVCSSLVALPKHATVSWQFAAGPPDLVAFSQLL